MAAPYPSFTKQWHSDTYPAISPAQPELSLKGKKVIVTGGGAGIGRGFTQAFADAGASSIAILGRRDDMLQETKKDIEATNSDVSISTHVVDIVDSSAVKKAAAEVGAWDILVSSAGYLPTMVSVADSDVEDWWKGWEINVKGAFNVVHSFLPTRNKDATILAVQAGSIHIPVSMQVNGSGYNASKFGALKFFEIVAAENPDVHVVSMHPGVVATDMHYKSTMRPGSLDTMEGVPSKAAITFCYLALQ